MPKSRQKIKSSLLIFHQYQFQKDSNIKKVNKSKEKKSKASHKKSTIDLQRKSENGFKQAVNKFRQLFQTKIQQKKHKNQQGKTLNLKQEEIKNISYKKNKAVSYKVQKVSPQKTSQKKVKKASKGLTELFNEMQKKLQNYKVKLGQNKKVNSLNVRKIQEKTKFNSDKSKISKQIQKDGVNGVKHYIPHKTSKQFLKKEGKINNIKSVCQFKKNKQFISYSLLNSSNKKHSNSKPLIKQIKNTKDIQNQFKSDKKNKQKSKQKLSKSKQKGTKSKSKLSSKSKQIIKNKRALTETDFKKQKTFSGIQYQNQIQNNSKFQKFYTYLNQGQNISDKKSEQNDLSLQLAPKKLQFQNQLIRTKYRQYQKNQLEPQQLNLSKITRETAITLQKYFKTFIQKLSFDQMQNKKSFVNNFDFQKICQAKKIKQFQNNSPQAKKNDKKNNIFYFQLNNAEITPTKSIKQQQQLTVGDSCFFQMMKQQEQKWLKLKKDLDKLKEVQNKTQYLQNLIKQVDNNYSMLQNIQIQSISPKKPKQETFSKAPKLDQQKSDNKKKYNEARINQKWLNKHVISKDTFKESQKLSMELSQKKLLEDIDLMNFISNNRSSRSLLFQSSSKQQEEAQQHKQGEYFNLKNSTFNQDQQKINNQESQSKQQLLISDFSPQKDEIKIQQINMIQLNQKTQLQVNPTQGKHSPFFQNKKLDVSKLQQEKFAVDNRQNECNLQDFQSREFLQNDQENISDSHNKIVQAFNQKKKQMLCTLIFQVILNEFSIQILKQKKIIDFLVDSYNKNIVQIHKYDDQQKLQKQNNQQMIDQNQVSFEQLKIKKDKSYIQLYAKQLLQYSLQDQQVKIRLNTPIGIKPLKCIKYMRYLQRDQDEEQFALSNQQFQNIISLQNIYAFQSLFDSEMSQYQQQFNQSICDAINNLLDYCRPFGKKGWPPICFNYRQKNISAQSIKENVLQQIDKIMSIKLGILNFNIQPSKIEKALRESLFQFSKACGQQFQQQLSKLQEIIFQIQFQIMNQIQSDIFMLITWQISQFIHFRNKKSFF